MVNDITYLRAGQNCKSASKVNLILNILNKKFYEKIIAISVSLTENVLQALLILKL